MKLRECDVLWNKKVSSGYFHMGVEVGDAFKAARAGQFVMIKTTGEGETLLRRPFSIHDVREDEGRLVLELLYKVVGPNTGVYAKLKPGQSVSVLGPLGNAFTLPEKGAKSFLVGGGIGIAPMLFLGRQLVEAGHDPSCHTVFIGGRSKEDVLSAEVFREMGLTVVETTDDGSLGEKGRITVPLERFYEKEKPSLVYACGPHPMLVGVAQLMEGRDALCELSLEIIMACGMGACMGCVVDGRDAEHPYHHVCIDGPVFDAKNLNM